MEGWQSEAQQLLASAWGGVLIFALGMFFGLIAGLSSWVRKVWNPVLTLGALIGVLQTSLLAYENDHHLVGLILVAMLVETILVVFVGFWRAKKHGLPFSPRNLRQRMPKAKSFDELV